MRKDGYYKVKLYNRNEYVVGRYYKAKENKNMEVEGFWTFCGSDCIYFDSDIEKIIKKIKM